MATLAGVLPATQIAFEQLARYAQTLGVSIGVADFGGFRTEADTAKILAYREADYAADRKAGRIPATMTIDRYRPIAPFGKSYHDFGAAFDVAVIARPSSLTVAQVLAKLGAYAPSIGLRWGGTFSNPDAPHFELAESLDAARQQYEAMVSGFGGMAGGSGGLSSAFDALNDDPFRYDVGAGGDLAASMTGPLLLAGALTIAALIWVIRR